MNVITVNILKNHELFVHFKSYLLKFRRQYELLCCLLAKLERTLPPLLGRLCIENGRRWLFLCLSMMCICGYHVYKEVRNPSIGEAFVCFAEEENSHDRKAVISTSDDISTRNIASEPSSGANTVVKHCSKGV